MSILNITPLSSRINYNLFTIVNSKFKSWKTRNTFLSNMYFLNNNPKSCLYIGNDKDLKLLKYWFPEINFATNPLNQNANSSFYENDYFKTFDSVIIRYTGPSYQDILNEEIKKFDINEPNSKLLQSEAEYNAMAIYDDEFEKHLNFAKKIKHNNAMIEFRVPFFKPYIEYFTGKLLLSPWYSLQDQTLILITNMKNIGTWTSRDFYQWLSGHNSNTRILDNYVNPYTGYVEGLNFPELSQDWDSNSEIEIFRGYLDDRDKIVNFSQELSENINEIDGTQITLAEIKGLRKYDPFTN